MIGVETYGPNRFTAGVATRLAEEGHVVVVPDYYRGAGPSDPGTPALLAAELSDRVAAAVLFFPSQPWFAELTTRTPVHPVDLLWALRGPALFLYGDQDPVLPPERLADLRDRLGRAGERHRLIVYPSAGHAFCAPVPPMRDDAADRASWADATGILREHLGAGPGAGPAGARGG